ncbi:MAG TPA: DSD1 family PLP-dependent enzyme [Pirellulales bacterium]
MKNDLSPVPLGSTKDDLDTPALCLDLDAMEANIRSMAETCSRAGVAWRPHAKGHKSSYIARLQLAAGALGVTCAKLGEAEMMADGGVTDLLIANMVVGPRKLSRLVALRRKADPIVCVDHLDQVEPLSRAFASEPAPLRVLIEVNIGLDRVGVAPGAPAVELARAIAARPGLRLAGIMGYEGHLLTLPDPADKGRQIHAALDQLIDTQRAIEHANIPCGIVSCAGTGSFRYAIEHAGITEVQAGGAIFMDVFYREKCQITDLANALTVLATVVSRPAPDRAIIDAGRKTLNIEVATPLVLGCEGVEVVRLSAEHGELRLAPAAQGLRIGDRLELLPGYADLTTVLHDVFYGFRGGRLEAILPIEARGKLA